MFLAFDLKLMKICFALLVLFEYFVQLFNFCFFCCRQALIKKTKIKKKKIFLILS